MQPFHLQSFESEAESILARAREKAKELLAAALAESERIREAARREGWEAGRGEGRAEAEKSERARIVSETSGVAALLEGVVRGLDAKRGDLLAEAERDLVALAIAIAERVVRAEVAAGKPVARDVMRRAVELAVRRNGMEVRIHPDDLALVETYLPDLRARFPGEARIELRGDPSVERGGCRVMTTQGAVDADLKTQIEELTRALLG